MSFVIKRPGDKSEHKPRLSSFGRRVVVGLLVVAAIVAAIVLANAQAARKRNELKQAVLDAVERSEVVCGNALSAVGAGTEAQSALQGFRDRIARAGDVDEKASVAQEMIDFALGHAGGNQAQVDELNGARNRIMLAMQQYER